MLKCKEPNGCKRKHYHGPRKSTLIHPHGVEPVKAEKKTVISNAAAKPVVNTTLEPALPSNLLDHPRFGMKETPQSLDIPADRKKETGTVVLPAARDPFKMDCLPELTYSTGTFLLARRGDIANYTYRQKLSSMLASVARGMGFEGTSYTKENRTVRRNVTARIFGGTFGAASRKVDTLRAMGYNTVEEVKVYSDLLKFLLHSSASRPRTISADFEPLDLACANFEALVKHNFREWFSEADHVIVKQTIGAAYQHFIIVDVAIQQMVTPKRIDYYQSGTPMGKVTNHGISRLVHHKPTQPLSYRFNGNWRLKGPAWQNGILDISKLPYYSACGYDTVYMGIPMGVHTNQDCTENAQRMSTRTFGVRKPDKEGLHEECVANQLENADLFDHSADRMSQHTHKYIINNCTPRWDELLDQAVENAPPGKERAYAAAREDLRHMGTFTEIKDNLYNEFKHKKEKAKPGKASRQYVNMGIPSTLVGAVLLSLLKEALSQHLTVDQGIRFVKRVNRTELDQWARIITDGPPNGAFAGFVHSDDGSLIQRVVAPDGMVHLTRADVDISGCDQSHGAAIFMAFHRLFPPSWQWLVEILYDQIFRPVRIYVGKTRLKGHLAIPTQPYLPSGHVYTTAINTFVLATLFREIWRKAATTETEICAIGKQYGYILTVDTWDTIQGPMFLKHRIADTTTGPHAILAFGTFLRSLGRTLGDLKGPRTMSVRERARCYVYNYLCSYSHGITVPFLEKMKETFRRKNTPLFTSKKNKKAYLTIQCEMKKKFEYKHNFAEHDTPISLTNAEFCSPYLHISTPTKLETLCENLQRMRIGSRYASETTDAIGKADYSAPGAHPFFRTTPWSKPCKPRVMYATN